MRHRYESRMTAVALCLWFVALTLACRPGNPTASATKPRTLAAVSSVTSTDSYEDGTPDFLRLSVPSDADAFRRWFGFLAESQYFTPKMSPHEIGDCAALVRFADREALRHHDGEWAAMLALPRLPSIPAVRQYEYPHTPLGAAIFRTREGRFADSDLRDGTFAEFADAGSLRRFNMHLISRRVADARMGDVLFFRQSSQQSPFHAMIFLERSQLDDVHEPLVVYHTGAIGKEPGEIRRHTLREMLDYPDARWRPRPQNRAFLGVYRWNILRGTD